MDERKFIQIYPALVRAIEKGQLTIAEAEYLYADDPAIIKSLNALKNKKLGQHYGFIDHSPKSTDRPPDDPPSHFGRHDSAVSGPWW